jgi:hypothetical protein
MKKVKVLAIALVATVALMAIGSSSASATALYKEAEKQGAGTQIVATLTGSATLKSTSGTLLDTCVGSEIKGEIAKAGGALATVSGPIKTLNWGACTEPTTTTTNGELEIHHISGGINGTLTAKKTTVDVNTTIFGAVCQYTVGEVLDLGTLNGSTSTTKDATITPKVVIPAENSFFCPDANWEATFNVTSPTPLHVTAS